MDSWYSLSKGTDSRCSHQHMSSNEGKVIGETVGIDLVHAASRAAQQIGTMFQKQFSKPRKSPDGKLIHPFRAIMSANDMVNAMEITLTTLTDKLYVRDITPAFVQRVHASASGSGIDPWEQYVGVVEAFAEFVQVNFIDAIGPTQDQDLKDERRRANHRADKLRGIVESPF